jgi:hypothetical protein
MPAVCERCKQDKKTSVGCIPHKYRCDGKLHVVVLFGDEREGYVLTGAKAPARCHDCHTQHGKPHHEGCPAERCPVCAKQLTVCKCAVKVVPE